MLYQFNSKLPLAINIYMYTRDKEYQNSNSHHKYYCYHIRRLLIVEGFSIRYLPKFVPFYNIIILVRTII